MVELYLIRHGKTYGNTLGRYIGTTDESLCEEGRRELESGAYPEVEAVYISPMKRCLETAGILWPKLEAKPFHKLRECSFGEFENKSYRELDGNPNYQAWVDSGGSLPFPGGESREEFQARCLEGFREVLLAVRGAGEKRVALVAHGGTIMSILEAYAVPKKGFYDWQARNGKGFYTCWDETDEGGIRLYETDGFDPDPGVSSGSGSW